MKGQKTDAGTALAGVLGACFLALVFAGCTQGELDRDGTLYQVNLALTAGDCDRAIELIEPLYNSKSVDNEVRMLRASAHGCAAGINFFDVLEELSTSSLVGSEFWEFSTRLFPSTVADSKMESSWLALDALGAAVLPSAAIPQSYVFNPVDKYNKGSIRANQRISESNVYLVHTALAVMGTMQNRYGSPNAAYLQGNDLPWSTNVGMTPEGCTYTAAIVGFLDAIDEVQDEVDPASAAQLAAVQAYFGAGINDACSYGCLGVEPDGADDIPGDNCETLVSPCSACPNELRSPYQCMNTLVGRCAAAGVVRMVNFEASPLGWIDAP